jgi:hypothetical protein
VASWVWLAARPPGINDCLILMVRRVASRAFRLVWDSPQLGSAGHKVDCHDPSTGDGEGDDADWAAGGGHDQAGVAVDDRGLRQPSPSTVAWGIVTSSRLPPSLIVTDAERAV